MNKKLISILLVITMLSLAFPIHSFADYTPCLGTITVFGDSASEEHPLIIERVDVSVNEALLDQTYSYTKSKYETIENYKATRSTYWDVYGTVWLSGENHFYSQAVGYSAQYDGDTLLDTYHYTRTFFGTANDNLGDSGRVWGNGLVMALGSLVPTGNVMYRIHRVYYGTTV